MNTAAKEYYTYCYLYGIIVLIAFITNWASKVCVSGCP